MSDIRVMKSYVWHEDKCFFVSTIDRPSSSPEARGALYAETMVWNYAWDTNERGELIHQDEGGQGTIYTHIKICTRLHQIGKPSEETC